MVPATFFLFLVASLAFHNSSNGQVDIQRLSFLAIGDFGGIPTFPFSTPHQRQVAEVMGKLADTRNATIVLGLGDNFYYDGVKSVDDPRFKSTFEDVFTAPALKRARWLMVAGNHDYRLNVSAQIAYSKKSPRWHFPYFYHTTVRRIPGTAMTVQIIMIDTMQLCNMTNRDQGFPSPSEQLRWIEQTLRYSVADYLVVGGHHPVLSAGIHGNTNCLLTTLKPLLERYDVTAYIGGHDHNLQHIKEDDASVNYFVSGNGNFCNHAALNQFTLPPNSLKKFYGLSGGFTVFDATPTTLFATQVSDTGIALYSTSMIPRYRTTRAVGVG